MSAQFEQLKTDFRYNLGLLEDRDAELEKYDASHALLTATLEDRDRQLAEIQKLHAEATSGTCLRRHGSGALMAKMIEAFQCIHAVLM